ncbi:hypothetical protein PVAG01_01180 [Phlyctema vagabunda]|uniref:Uncharacterized protein n=1 Tax=Phlyctema vagabunda TaxID=108571 RepID=A0ABR4PXR8_9HELO
MWPFTQESSSSYTPRYIISPYQGVSYPRPPIRKTLLKSYLVPVSMPLCLPATAATPGQASALRGEYIMPTADQGGHAAGSTRESTPQVPRYWRQAHQADVSGGVYENSIYNDTGTHHSTTSSHSSRGLSSDTGDESSDLVLPPAPIIRPVRRSASCSDIPSLTLPSPLSPAALSPYTFHQSLQDIGPGAGYEYVSPRWQVAAAAAGVSAEHDGSSQHQVSGKGKQVEQPATIGLGIQADMMGRCEDWMGRPFDASSFGSYHSSGLGRGTSGETEEEAEDEPGREDWTRRPSDGSPFGSSYDSSDLEPSCSDEIQDSDDNGDDEDEEDWVLLDRQMELLQTQRDGLSELMESVGRLRSGLWNRIARKARARANV